jgi:alanine dehydrogenase
MESDQKGYRQYSLNEGLMPREEMLEIHRQHKQLTIGIPAEVSRSERRVPLVPAAAGLLVQNGHIILVEAKAGEKAGFEDHEYSEVGAQIVYTSDEVYRADLILKVSPPSIEEIGLMRERQALISAIHLTDKGDIYFRSLMAKKVTAIGYEYIKDKFGSFPVRRSISEIVGNASVLIAAHYLSDSEFGKGRMLGGFSGITPTEVVILGAGTVGENAARVAIGLGAMVKIFDDSVYRLRRIQTQLNTRIFTSILQPKVLAKALRSADVLIGAIHASHGKSPCVVTDQMVKEMKSGAVIIDVSIDQGGCVETSKPTTIKDPVFNKYDVIHYGVPNIASSVPQTASYALSNFFAPLILKAGEEGGVENLIRSDRNLCNGVYLYKGVLTNKYISDLFDLPFQDLDLLLAAFH